MLSSLDPKSTDTLHRNVIVRQIPVARKLKLLLDARNKIAEVLE